MVLPYDPKRVDEAGRHFDETVRRIQAREFAVGEPPEARDLQGMRLADATAAAKGPSRNGVRERPHGEDRHHEDRAGLARQVQRARHAQGGAARHLPFQVIETINESRATREIKKARAGPTLFDLWEGKEGDTFEDGWRNKLIWGDNLLVMGSLLEKFAGKIDLIYIDPPFATGADFSFEAQIGESGREVFKEQSVIEEKVYRDTWGSGADSFIAMMYERLTLMRDLLHEDGSIYVHCDWRMAQHLRLVIEDIFGRDNYRNEIVWKRKGGSANAQNNFGVAIDTIHFATRSASAKFRSLYTRDSEEAKKYIEERFRNEFNGRRYMLAPIERNAALGVRENLIYEYKGYTPKYGWMMVREKLAEFDRLGKLHWNSNKKPNRRVFLDEYEGQPIENLWLDVFVINPMAAERVDYPTQKPEALLERILNRSLTSATRRH